MVYKANGKQIRFLRRNLAHTDRLIAAYDQFLEIGKTFSISQNTVSQFTRLFKASHYSMEDFLELRKAAFDTMFSGHITKK